MDHPRPDDPRDAPHVVIVVVRSGGIAGLRKQWRAEPPPPEAPRWIALIDDCPWDDEVRGPAGADRFVWHIQVVRGDAPPRTAEVPDSLLDGPWRTLVDEVRGASPQTPRPPRSAREE